MTTNLDVFKLMAKIPDHQTDNFAGKPGYVTDGLGYVYILPRIGKTPFFTIEGIENEEIKFKYNWESGELEIYSIDPITKNDYKLESYKVSKEDFVDSPDYWARVAYTDAENLINSAIQDIKLSEAVNPDKKEPYLVLKIGVFADRNGLYTIQNAKEMMEVLKNFHITREYYDHKYDIKTRINGFSLELVVTGEVSLLNQGDIKEIFDDFNRYVINMAESKKLGKYHTEFTGVDIFDE